MNGHCALIPTESATMHIVKPTLSDSRVLFLDLQTTGSTPQSGNPLEIAWCCGTASEEVPEMIESFLLQQPDGEVPRRIQTLTGITEEQMVEASDPALIAEMLRRQMKLAGLMPFAIIHYAKFEQGFLRQSFPEFGGMVSVVCTHQIAKRLFPNLPSRGIRGLAGYFGLSLEEAKRAAHHVEATFVIWQNLCRELEARGITSFEDLTVWLSKTQPAKRVKYEYPMQRDARLALPDQPGVYRMLSKTGDVLYVGKATSLKDRVNSYFRGRKNRDTRKLEMLTQAWDLRITPCATVLEACLLEVAEIKRLSPPYNISLKQADRPVLFYSVDFSEYHHEQTEAFPIGPFRSELVMDSFARLVKSLKEGEFDQNIFFDELDKELLDAGFTIFCDRLTLSREVLVAPRTLLALAIRLMRQYDRLRAEMEDDDEALDEVLAEQEAESNTVTEHRISPDDETMVADYDQAEFVQEIVFTPEEIADRFTRMLMRSARSYLQSKRLTRLLNSIIEYEEEGGRSGVLCIENGSIISLAELDGVELAVSEAIRIAETPSGYTPDSCMYGPWKNLMLSTYDRMRVLDTELQHLRNIGQYVSIKTASPPTG